MVGGGGGGGGGNVCVCVILSCVQLLNGPLDLPYMYKFTRFFISQFWAWLIFIYFNLKVFNSFIHQQLTDWLVILCQFF